MTRKNTAFGYVNLSGILLYFWMQICFRALQGDRWMKFKKIALMGAGAIGSYLVWGLSEKAAAGEIDFCVVANGERKERFERNGFMINGEKYRPVIMTPEEARGADLLVITLKYGSLRPALDDIRRMVGPDTVVMSLMNGVDTEEIIGEALGGTKQIVYSLMKIASERWGNRVNFNAETTIGMIYGETEENGGASRTDRTDALNALFEGTGMHYRVTDCILSEMWTKFRLNVQNNQPQAIIGVGVGAYRDSEHVRFMQQKLREEVTKIGEAKGICFELADPSSASGSPVKDRARYSTLQDLDARRHTEVDMFSGAVMRMGRELGIPTPYNEFAYHAIKALEEKNDGLFNYD